MKVLNRNDMTHRHTVQTQLGRGLHASAGTLRRAALVAVIAGAVLSAPAQAASVPGGLVSSGGASACASPEAMIGTAGDDTIIGTPGPDIICGLGGNDVLIGYQGDDILVGGPGDDTLRGARDNDQLFGDDGNDRLVAGPYGGIDVLQGGLGDDTADYSYPWAVSISLDGVANDGEPGETDNVQTDIENVVGGDGPDTLTGNELANTLTGNGGNDVLIGYQGDDILVGGPGDDTLRGARDSDRLFGDDGHDVLFPGLGGTDVLQGGAGNDTANYSYFGAVNVSLNGVADDGESGENDNVQTDVENVVGGAGNDTITGNEFANQLTGGSGQDVLSGLSGNDVLNAVDGEVDQVACGPGDDWVNSDPDDIVSPDCDRRRPPVLAQTCTGPFATTFAFTINTIDAVPAGETWSVTASLSASPRNLTVSSSSSFVQGISAGPTRVNLTTPTGIPAGTTVTLTPSNYLVPTSGSNRLELAGYGGSTAASFSTSNRPC